MKAIRAIAYGRVQGVCFRYYAKETADSLGVTGFVRNLSDGTVEVFFQGDQVALEKMVDWLKHGPPYAHVEQLDLEKQEFDGRFVDFQVTR